MLQQNSADPMADGEEFVACTRSFFEEAESFQQRLAELCSLCAQRNASANDRSSMEACMQFLTSTLEKYQEQPHLLDKQLEAITAPVVDLLRKQFLSAANDASPLSEEGHLFRYLYFLTKVRGYKTVVKFLTHEAADVEPLSRQLVSLNRSDFTRWEARYILLLWLSLAVRVPFDLKRLDSNEASNGLTLIESLLQLGQSFLDASGKEREGAAEFLARLLTRKDTIRTLLPSFIQWALETGGTEKSVFKILGVLLTLATLFKYGDRDLLIQFAQPVIGLSEMFLDPKKSRFHSNTVVRKLAIKLIQRVGLVYLKPVVAPWRYQRGRRCLQANLEKSSAARIAAGMVAAVDEMALKEDPENWDVPEEIEAVIELLLSGLQDKDTIVRWSSSKGIGRITQRLPKELAQDIINSVVDLFSINTLSLDSNRIDVSNCSDQAWHGACLALAELARRGLMLPAKLPEVTSWIREALKFDQRRGSNSIGSHVRDAACYVCWSFARAYEPDVMRPYVDQLSSTLVSISLFDREINVRRAASAAFQENVGRQGLFPHGIEIVTAADYFAVGIRKESFTSTSKEVAKFGEYCNFLLTHLVNSCSVHWDPDMRLQSSLALYELVPFDPQFFLTTLLPILLSRYESEDLVLRHGSLISIAESVLSLHMNQNVVPEDLRKEVVAVPAKLWRNHFDYFNTFGSDIFRLAICRYIACLSMTKWDLSLEDVAIWDDILKSTLERKEEQLQKESAAAFCSFTAQYGITEESLARILPKVDPSSDSVHRRGYAWALGQLPVEKLDADQIRTIVTSLCVAGSLHADTSKNDTEARRNALQGLTVLLSSIPVHTFKSIVSKSLFRQVALTMLNGLCDYSSDTRGDVGSWVRETSIRSLRTIIAQIMECDKQDTQIYFTDEICTSLFSKIIQQSVEKIDRVRQCAGEFIVWAVNDNVTHLNGVELLRKTFQRNQVINWTSPMEVFPKMVPLLSIPQYRLDLLTGIIASVGGLTESLVRFSSRTLIEYLSNLPVETESSDEMSLSEMVRSMNVIFQRYSKEDRIILPMLSVYDILFNANLLQPLAASPTQSDLLIKSFTFIKQEVTKCKDAKKILSAIKVFCELSMVAGEEENELKRLNLQQLLNYLKHPFPKVRRFTAEQLYMALTSWTDIESDDKATELEGILIETNWDLPPKELETERQKLYELFNITMPLVMPKA